MSVEHIGAIRHEDEPKSELKTSYDLLLKVKESNINRGKCVRAAGQTVAQPVGDPLTSFALVTKCLLILVYM